MLGGAWFESLFSIFIFCFHFLKTIFIFNFFRFREYVWLRFLFSLFKKSKYRIFSTQSISKHKGKENPSQRNHQKTHPHQSSSTIHTLIKSHTFFKEQIVGLVKLKTRVFIGVLEENMTTEMSLILCKTVRLESWSAFPCERNWSLNQVWVKGLKIGGNRFGRWWQAEWSCWWQKGTWWREVAREKGDEEATDVLSGDDE